MHTALCRVSPCLTPPFAVFQLKSPGRNLFDMVCTHLNLLETDYFGLEYVDSQGVKVSTLSSRPSAERWLGAGCPVWGTCRSTRPPEMSHPARSTCLSYYPARRREKEGAERPARDRERPPDRWFCLDGWCFVRAAARSN